MRNPSRPHRDLIPALLAATLLCTPSLAQAYDQPFHVGYVESTTRPIRVHYETESASGMAQQILAMAEDAWTIQIEQMGFSPPVTRDASDNIFEGLWIYLITADHGQGKPTGDVPGTPWTDCTVDIIIPLNLQQSLWESYVHHESNHGLQMAQDCTEAWFAYEQTTVAVDAILFPEDYLLTAWMLPTFQRYPHHGIDCTFFGNQDKLGYHYGAALFSVFLDEYYGEGTGELLPEFWEAARQDGTVTVGASGATSNVPNDPDLLEGIATALANRGVTLHEAFTKFAQWRYFVGDRDDGKHFDNGALWVGSEVTVAEGHGLDDLPLVGAEVVDHPNEYGSSYVEVDLTGLTSPNGIVLDFAGNDLTKWHISALAVGGNSATQSFELDVSGDGQGTLALPGIAGAETLVLIFTALGDEDHNANSPSCTVGYGFTYDLRVEDLETVPAPESMDPGELAAGSTQMFTVEGAGFVDGLTVELDGPHVGEEVILVSTTVVDENTLTLEITAGAAAQGGTYDLVLTNPNGQQATLAGALEVVPVDPYTPPESGCNGCTAGTTGGGGGSLLLVLLVWLFIDWRRPRRPRRGRPR